MKERAELCDGWDVDGDDGIAFYFSASNEETRHFKFWWCTNASTTSTNCARWNFFAFTPVRQPTKDTFSRISRLNDSVITIPSSESLRKINPTPICSETIFKILLQGPELVSCFDENSGWYPFHIVDDVL